jgi:hypothetical protein
MALILGKKMEKLDFFFLPFIFLSGALFIFGSDYLLLVLTIPGFKIHWFMIQHTLISEFHHNLFPPHQNSESAPFPMYKPLETLS